MIIEQPEAFKTWLAAVLKPLCDADPAALAKYVLALIKKDKSEEELQKLMVGQLEVFLENETESFVKLVLQTLETQDYITTPVIPNTNPPNPIAVKAKETKTIIPPSELPNLSESVNGAAPAVVAAPLKRKADSDKDEKVRQRPRNRSRSRSWDRSKQRSKSPHRGGDKVPRERPRAWRNKSPPRRFEHRRRSRTPSPSRGPRSRSPPKHRSGGRYRNRTPPKGSLSRSRSRSPANEKRSSRPGTPTQDSNHGDMDLRLTNSTQSIQSVVVQQQPPNNNTSANKRRCRDFDEKGYCMRGEMCPFDHGIDPVVLEDSQLSSVLTYNPNGQGGEGNMGGGAPPMMGPRGIPPEYNPQAPQMWTRPGFRGPRPMGMPRGPMLGAFPGPPNMQRELIPIPVLDNKHHQGHHHHQHHHHQHHHPYPAVGGGFRPQYPGNNMGGEAITVSPPQVHPPQPYVKKSFDFNRLGPRGIGRGEGPGKNPANCSLELKKIPQGLNSITHLNNHFCKFGKTTNIQVNYEGDPEAAIVTFSSHAEANAAYRSTEAVLNNRFIKVFWHNGTVNMDGNKQENVPPRSVKDRLGIATIVPPNTNKVLNLVQPKVDNEKVGNAPIADTEKEDNKAQANAAIVKNQELLAAKEKLKKDQDEQRKEVIKIKNDLRKRKQELLEKQLTQQRVLIDKMEKLAPGPQRDLVIDTIKKTQESIENIKKDLLQSVLTVKMAPQKRAKEDYQREMLDAELDLMTKQQEGVDTSEIQKKLLDLKARAAMSRGRGRGARRFNPISRHLLTKNNLVDPSAKNAKAVNKASFQKHTVDHRPTRLLVSGYETDEQESVLNHFQSFGEIADYVTDATLPSITLNYKTRKEAEMALLKGKHFQDRTLSITWCGTTASVSPLEGRAPVRQLSESEEDRLMEPGLPDGEEDLGPEISEEALLQDDEEEDEENEDRSWRR